MPRFMLRNIFFCSHAYFRNILICSLRMNNVINTFLSVISPVRSKQLLCSEYGQDQQREQKHTTNNFEESHNHSPY